MDILADNFNDCPSIPLLMLGFNLQITIGSFVIGSCGNNSLGSILVNNTLFKGGISSLSSDGTWRTVISSVVTYRISFVVLVTSISNNASRYGSVKSVKYIGMHENRCLRISLFY